MTTDPRVLALDAIEDVEQRARESSALAKDAAAAAKAARQPRNAAAIESVHTGMATQAEMLEITGLTRRAFVKVERLIAQTEVACPTSKCKADAGKRCKGLPPGAIHPKRHEVWAKAYDKQPPTYDDPVAVASEYAALVQQHHEVEQAALAVRKAALDALHALDVREGWPAYQPSDLARIAGLTTARITQMGYTSREPAA